MPKSVKGCALYSNCSIIIARGGRYFFDQTSQLLVFSLLLFVRLLFEAGYYSRKAFISLETHRHQRRCVMLEQEMQLRLLEIDTASQSCFQPWKQVVQLKTALALARWSLSEIICIHVHVLHILVTCKGGVYFIQSFRLCGYYSKMVSI